MRTNNDLKSIAAAALLVTAAGCMGGGGGDSEDGVLIPGGDGTGGEARTFAAVAGATVTTAPKPATGGTSGASAPTSSSTTSTTFTAQTIAINPAIVIASLAAVSQPVIWCRKGDGTACSSYEWSHPEIYKQIVVFPTGYQSEDYSTFVSAFDTLLIRQAYSASTAYSTVHKSKIMYVAHWTPGGALGTTVSNSNAVFHAAVMTHPVRGKALSLKQSEVFAKANEVRNGLETRLRPWSVLVIYKTNATDITANASPPGLSMQPYGIAKIPAGDLSGNYIAVHELAHASLNFLDEYVEGGMENLSINSIDIITPLAILDPGSWGSWITAIQNLLGVYEYRISEVLAANGNENIDVTRYPDRVTFTGEAKNNYECEGGMFVGKGTYHDQGDNIMNSSSVQSCATGDRFAYAHSPAQLRVVNSVFGDRKPPRRNNRLRTAGPKGFWAWEMGGTSVVMIFDGDKNHQYWKTKRYDVQVTWQDREWDWGCFCYRNTWHTAERSVTPGVRTIKLGNSALYGLAGFVQGILCGLGITEFQSGSGSFQLCSLSLNDAAGAFLPTMEFPVPYQNVTVPTSQWFTYYFWRFRTDNGLRHYPEGDVRNYSNWTAYQEFYRSF